MNDRVDSLIAEVDAAHEDNARPCPGCGGVDWEDDEKVRFCPVCLHYLVPPRHPRPWSTQ